MSRFRTALVAAGMGASLLVGGAAGAAIMAGANVVSAATTPTPSGTPASGAGGAGTTTPGKFVPNEDPTHEAGESAAREAQENAGQVPNVP